MGPPLCGKRPALWSPQATHDLGCLSKASVHSWQQAAGLHPVVPFVAKNWKPDRAGFSFAITVTWRLTTQHPPSGRSGRIPWGWGWGAGMAGGGRAHLRGPGCSAARPTCSSAARAPAHLRARTPGAGLGRRRPRPHPCGPRRPRPSGRPSACREGASLQCAPRVPRGRSWRGKPPRRARGPARNSRRAGAASLKTGEGVGAGREAREPPPRGQSAAAAGAGGRRVRPGCEWGAAAAEGERRRAGGRTFSSAPGGGGGGGVSSSAPAGPSGRRGAARALRLRGRWGRRDRNFPR